MAWTQLNAANPTAGNAILASDHAAAFTNLNEAPRGYVIGAKTTSNQTSITSGIDATGMSVTVPQINGRQYRITVHAEAQSSAANDVVVLELTDATPTSLQRATDVLSVANIAQTLTLVYYETAAATGNVTRKVRVSRASGSGNVQLNAASTRPGLILVEDMGAPT